MIAIVHKEELSSKPSKNQKKKKAAQKKKRAKKADNDNEKEQSLGRIIRLKDEIDARIVDQLNDTAMASHDFQMLNLKGKMLAHPSLSFLEALSHLRQSMSREVYPHRISHARRFFSLGLGKTPLPSYNVAMGTATFVPINQILRAAHAASYSDESEETTLLSFFEPAKNRPDNAYTDSFTSLAILVWYPVMTHCMSTGDKLSCIALRDTCVTLRRCYGLFRNDTTRLEQFAFDMENTPSVKQLDWVARRIEVPPSPPQTPPPEKEKPTPPPVKSDPFRAPAVVGRRWSDYDSDDDSLGSPMFLPHSGSPNDDIPDLDLNVNAIRRPQTVLIAVPSLTNNAFWFSTKKTVLPVPRIMLLVPEEYPRSLHSQSTHPMKLQSAVSRPYPVTANQKVRGRLEHWVREDVEKNLKMRLSLTAAARKKADAETENLIFNRYIAFSGLNSGDLSYVGESDILGADVGICVEDILELITARFKMEKEKIKGSRVTLISSPDGWICKQIVE